MEHLIAFLYFIVLLVLGYVISILCYRNNRKLVIFFNAAILIKLIVSICFTFLYYEVEYSGGGDYTGYFDQSKILSNVFWEDSESFLYYLNKEDATYDLNEMPVISRLNHFRSPATAIVVKIGAVLSLISFNNIYVISMFCALFAFFGAWLLFSIFYQKIGYFSAFAIFHLIPSVTFWSSALMKDTFTLGVVFIGIYCFYDLSFKKGMWIIGTIGVVISTVVLIYLKIYIAMAFLVFILFYCVHFLLSISGITRNILVFIAIVSVIGIFTVSDVYEKGQEFTLKLAQIAVSYQDYHEYLALSEGQSGYSLGEMDLSLTGLAKIFVPAVNVALFRPYIFEVRNMFMLFIALENTIMLLFTIFVLFKVGVFRSIKIVFSNSFLFAALVFVITLAFVVGFSSYNFGALSRYRIPLIPIYLLILFCLAHYGRAEQKKSIETSI